MRGNTVKKHRTSMVAKIISKMESGQLQWLRPWNHPKLQLPFNPITQTRYSGINIAYLLTEAEEHGFDDPRWMTYIQAQEKGFRIKRGARGAQIEFWSTFKPSTREPEAKKSCEAGLFPTISNRYSWDIEPEEEVRFCKIYTVFNASQIDGVETWDAGDVKQIDRFRENERCERIIEGCGVGVTFGYAGACYSCDLANPLKERIKMPNREWFKDESHFYATMLHEIGHSTGNPLRMNRDIGHPFGSKEYALEELRAEFASAFLLMDVQLVLDDEGMESHVRQHAAYIKHWKEIADESPDVFARAIRDAHKIADLVLSYDAVALEKAG